MANYRPLAVCFQQVSREIDAIASFRVAAVLGLPPLDSNSAALC